MNDFGGVLGAKIVPNSTKMASETCSILDEFPDLRLDQFSTRFWLQHGLQNERVFEPETQRPTLQICCFANGFYTFLEVRSLENPSKNGCRAKPVLIRVSDFVSGRFSDGFQSFPLLFSGRRLFETVFRRFSNFSGWFSDSFQSFPSLFSGR